MFAMWYNIQSQLHFALLHSHLFVLCLFLNSVCYLLHAMYVLICMYVHILSNDVL